MEPTITDLKAETVFAITEPCTPSPSQRFDRRARSLKVTTTYRVTDVISEGDKSSVFELATLDGKRVTRAWRNTTKIEIMTPDADELAILWV